MTRIIAGTLGGRLLAVPPKGTRPTTDRVREAIFSRLDHEKSLRGAWVLDAFAGSGALGIEALSRGAKHAVFVESNSAAVAVIRANAESLGVTKATEVARDKVLPWLGRSTRPVDLATFDLALLDPPYDLPPEELAATLAALVPRLTEGAVVVVEWSSRSEAPAWPKGLVPTGAKRYGETTVHYAVASGAALSGAALSGDDASGEDASAEETPPSDSLDT
ncbi:MAG TPA: 16S rRNA (guanine(966)-N(2))-methyltransferase RsmD [Demequinaceae bacterium]